MYPYYHEVPLKDLKSWRLEDLCWRLLLNYTDSSTKLKAQLVRAWTPCLCRAELPWFGPWHLPALLSCIVILQTIEPMVYGLNKKRALTNSTPIFVTIPKDQTINYPQSSMNMQHFLAVRYREIVGDFDWTESLDFFVLPLVVGLIDDNFWEKSIIDTVTRLHSFTIVQHAPAHPHSYSSWNTSTCKEKRSAERNEWRTQLKSEESKNLVDSSGLDGRPAGSLSPVEPWATGTAVAQERPSWR